MSKRTTCAIGAIPRAALWLPFCFGAALFFFAAAFGVQPAAAQTTGLPPAVSGDCSISATGVVTCAKTAGTAFAASATVDATNAGNIVSGSLPVARMATALASPAALGFTAPNLARIAADNNSTQNFTQWFTSTNLGGTGTQPGSTGIVAGLNCEGFWTVVSGTSVRAGALCYNNTADLSFYETASAVTFGSEQWTAIGGVSHAGVMSGNQVGTYSSSSSASAQLLPALNGNSLDLGTCSVSSSACYKGGFNLYDDGTYRDGIDFLTSTYRFRLDASSGTKFLWASCAYTLSLPACTSFGQMDGTGLKLLGAAGRFLSSSVTAGFNEVLYTPASSSAACTAGDFWDDANYHYVCTATNTIKRVALAAF
jgi:hypothetical protein